MICNGCQDNKLSSFRACSALAEAPVYCYFTPHSPSVAGQACGAIQI